MSLHTADPGESGGDEINGEGYSRVEVKLSRVAPGTVTNEEGISFRDLPAAKITHFGVWDERDGGNYLMGGPLAMPHQVYAGNNLGWQEAEIVLRVGQGG